MEQRLVQIIGNIEFFLLMVPTEIFEFYYGGTNL